MSTFDVSCVLSLTVNKLALLWGEAQLCLLNDQLRTLNSLGWQGGDFAFSASFLILNEIMRPGHCSGGNRGELAGQLHSRCLQHSCENIN